MEVTPLIAPILNVSALPLKLRRELDSSSIDPKNAFVLSKVMPNVESILHFSFLIEGLVADEVVVMIEPSALKFAVLQYHDATPAFPIRKVDLIITGSASEFDRVGISQEISNYLKHYKKQVGGV